jgi:hypothetical protein
MWLEEGGGLQQAQPPIFTTAKAEPDSTRGKLTDENSQSAAQ